MLPTLLSCADLQTALQTKLTIDWRTGVAATDWDTIAKKEHLDQLSVEMRKVEGQIREIYAEMLQLQQREQEMRDLNGGFELSRTAAAPSCVGGGSRSWCAVAAGLPPGLLAGTGLAADVLMCPLTHPPTHSCVLVCPCLQRRRTAGWHGSASFR